MNLVPCLIIVILIKPGVNHLEYFIPAIPFTKHFMMLLNRHCWVDVIEVKTPYVNCIFNVLIAQLPDNEFSFLVQQCFHNFYQVHVAHWVAVYPGFSPAWWLNTDVYQIHNI